MVDSGVKRIMRNPDWQAALRAYVRLTAPTIPRLVDSAIDSMAREGVAFRPDADEMAEFVRLIVKTYNREKPE